MSTSSGSINVNCWTSKRSKLYATRPSNSPHTQINLHGIAERGQRTSPSQHLRRCTWAVLRSHGTVQNRGQYSLHKLSISGWLCGSRILLARNCMPTALSKNQIQGKTDHFKRQSRIQKHHSKLWILRWMHAKVWKQQCLENANLTVWLSATYSCGWRTNLWNAWRPFTQYQNTGRY